jgi:hypothetical protein
MDTENKEVEILTDDFKTSFNETSETNYPSVSKKTRMCGFDPEM